MLHLRTTLEAIEHASSQKNIGLFSILNILSEREFQSRQEIAYAQYFKTINIEAETTERIAMTQLFPACITYLQNIHPTGSYHRAIGALEQEIAHLTEQFGDALAVLRRQNRELGGETAREKAYHMAENVLPAMESVRLVADQLERLIPEHLWQLPSYQQLLWLK